MNFKDLQGAIETFKGKTDIWNKGLAMCELTKEEVDEGSASMYFEGYGNQ